MSVSPNLIMILSIYHCFQMSSSLCLGLIGLMSCFDRIISSKVPFSSSMSHCFLNLNHGFFAQLNFDFLQQLFNIQTSIISPVFLRLQVLHRKPVIRYFRGCMKFLWFMLLPFHTLSQIEWMSVHVFVAFPYSLEFFSNHSWVSL